MNGEISLSSFAEALLPVADSDTEMVCPDKLMSGLMNGHATDFVYNILSLPERRRHGVFFSGSTWAKKILSGHDLTQWRRFIDPSVGIGDLLLEVCRTLTLGDSISHTIEDWAERLVAVDLRKSFLEITWMRIQALAMYRHKTEKMQSFTIEFKELPESFIVGDALLTELKLRPTDCIVMNPPYQRILATPNSFVGKGKRSAAALHIEKILLQAPAGVGLFALIPDVLRSGSSYEKFRQELNERTQIISFESFGAFGTQADIDVAILVASTDHQENHKKAPSLSENPHETVGVFFDVSVGPVVPHRTPTAGKPYGYLTAKNSLVGADVNKPNEYATYSCRLEEGPFVIVRRTSSPSDKKRARATLIRSKEKFLVENHLLILKPKDKKVKTCRLLMKALDNSKTDNWLNSHIRCRHLTVGALKKLPWILG